MKERRRHFLINKPLQLRYMVYFTGTLLLISALALMTLYVSVWSSILNSFSSANVRNDLLTAARMAQYEKARYPHEDEPLTALSLFKESDKLSRHQREIFKDILTRANRELILKLCLLFVFIAWGSIFLSHKIAGPLYRFHNTLTEIQKGNFKSRIHLRNGDEGKSLASEFNRTLIFLDELTRRLKQIVRKNKDNKDLLIAELNQELNKLASTGDL